MSQIRPPPYQNVSCECGGQRFQGAWYEAHGFVHIASAYGSKSAKVGRKEPGVVAQKLFAQVCEAWCGK
jgi:hypothetical protein